VELWVKYNGWARRQLKILGGFLNFTAETI
jgi:hypothetical protein